MRTVELLGLADWDETTIPDSSPPVAIARLHVETGTGASTSLVRFPGGWSRPGTGHYAVGEEVVVLSGTLTVSGVTYRAGDYGWIPALATRTASESPDGALVLAWFSGLPRWVAGDRAGPGQGRSLHLDDVRLGLDGQRLRGGHPGDEHGEAWLLPPGCAVVGRAEVLDPATGVWTFLDDDDPPLRTTARVFGRRLMPPPGGPGAGQPVGS